MLLRRLAQIAAVLASCAAVQTACSGDPAPSESPDSGISDDTGTSRSVCPDAAPDATATCLLPEGTTCSFDGCGTKIAQCTKGVWRYATNPELRPACPPEPPGLDELCPPCWPEARSCPYGSTDCSLPDASANAATASCVGGKWVVDIRPCNPSKDAGADVQGDAGLDGD